MKKIFFMLIIMGSCSLTAMSRSRGINRQALKLSAGNSANKTKSEEEFLVMLQQLEAEKKILGAEKEALQKEKRAREEQDKKDTAEAAQKAEEDAKRAKKRRKKDKFYKIVHGIEDVALGIAGAAILKKL